VREPPVCLRYRYTGLNGFTGTMVVGMALAGSWERVATTAARSAAAVEEQ
jgi:hypothetical protein